MNRQWELFLPREEFVEFTKLMDDHGCGGFTASMRNGSHWIICYPTDEAKLLARLKFHIEEVVDKFGIDVSFTDCPGHGDNL